MTYFCVQVEASLNTTSPPLLGSTIYLAIKSDFGAFTPSDSNLSFNSEMLISSLF